MHAIFFKARSIFHSYEKEINVSFYKHSVFRSEAWIRLSVSQSKPRNMLILCSIQSLFMQILTVIIEDLDPLE